MNERIRELAVKAYKEAAALGSQGVIPMSSVREVQLEKFAELLVKDYAQKTIQGLMSDPAFVQAMDEYYEQKWAHRFD